MGHYGLLGLLITLLPTLSLPQFDSPCSPNPCGPGFCCEVKTAGLVPTRTPALLQFLILFALNFFRCGVQDRRSAAHPLIHLQDLPLVPPQEVSEVLLLVYSLTHLLDQEVPLLLFEGNLHSILLCLTLAFPTNPNATGSPIVSLTGQV